MSDELISHVGIAVANLENSIKTYELLTGGKAGEIQQISDQAVRIVMIHAHPSSDFLNSAAIELLEPTSVDSPVGKFLSRRGEGLHHICIYVDDIEKRLAELKQHGTRLIDSIPRTGADGNKIAFVHPDSTGGVLVELEEKLS